MQKIFQKTDVLDKRACKKFLLSDELLMENAARSLSDFIRDRVASGAKVLFLCGGGNNGADGYAAARMLQGSYDVSVVSVYAPKSELAKKQFERARATKLKILKTLPKSFDVCVDCVLGSGQSGELDKNLANLILAANAKNSLKIACDIPTGIHSKTPFKADFTLTMGALKSVLFEDIATDFTGEIVVCDLGLERSVFEGETDMFLLERDDLLLPKREKKNSNKGDFGHLVIVSGEHQGAAILSGLSALTVGCGLVSLLTDNKSELCVAPSLMQTSKFPQKATALAVGMGLGDTKIDTAWFEKLPFVADADMCYDERILQIQNAKCVLTPHPKEFAALLGVFGFGEFDASGVQAERFELAKRFSLKFQGVLVLKGANTIVAHEGVLYVCTLGTNALSKG
ncbi:MAG: NAD(P)H-hydrate epimerase, partial [Campylobacteraceae bacterium]|nr:NAD(P)H-hydrate epimerase [Campylobacteraceae bacterium]